MKITYIHHSSFMAELDHAVLLFDYFEGNIPETDRAKPLFVFASHRHGDHFSRSIFDLEESRGNVTYVLSLSLIHISEIEQMKLLGVDNIITDYPVRAREILYREETTETLMEYLKMMLR